MTELSAPELLSSTHAINAFDWDEPVLNDRLTKRALKNEDSGASRTFVVCKSNQIMGYYVLATGSVMHTEAPRKIRRNMPEPIAVMIPGRLVVD